MKLQTEQEQSHKIINSNKNKTKSNRLLNLISLGPLS